jgi:hypothetical protein
MSLQKEVERRRLAMKTDSYSMSLGELMNLYESGELDLHPDFQRFFRWTDEQKTRLIESILLGIPLPPIFVSQRTDGVWDVIDGLQRLSAIFQFAGILKDEEKKAIGALVLKPAKYLPSLKGKTWEDEADANNPHALTPQQRIDIKRSKIDVNIILRESSADAKYDMFERLNTGGTQLSDQEVRNCLLLMSNKAFFSWIEKLATHDTFISAISLTDKAREERYDMELAVRFVTLRTIGAADIRGLVDVGTFLTDRIVAMSTRKMNLIEEGQVFRKTFDILNSAMSDGSFRRYDPVKARFMGGFLVSVFEVIGLGLGHHIARWNDNAKDREAIVAIAKSIWSNVDFTNHQGSGIRGTDRISHTVPLGRRLFQG